MKRYSTGILLALVTGSALLGNACGNSSAAQQNESDSSAINNTSGKKKEITFAADSICFRDSLIYDSCKATVSIAGKYPVNGHNILLDSIRQWLGERISYSDIFSNRQLLKPDAELLAEGKLLIQKTAAKIIDQARADFRDFASEGIRTQYEFSANFSPEYVSDSLITYIYTVYGYAGGAHGGYLFSAQSFNTNNGKKLTYSNSFNQNSRTKLVSLIRNALWEQYFNANADNPEASLRDMLLINPDTLPLPVCPPEFLADGVCFTYQQYEIAPYSAGLPNCKLPYSVIKPLLTEETLQLIP